MPETIDDIVADETAAIEAEAEVTSDDHSEELEAEAADDVSEEDDGDATEDDGPEEVEFDFGGEKLRIAKDAIPEELADKIGRFTKGTWADYTRKSQDLAGRAKQLEAAEAAVQRFQTLNAEALDTYAKGLRVKQEIEQLAGIDVDALWQSDPDRARRVSDRSIQAQAELQRIANEVSVKEAELAKAQMEEVGRRATEGKAAIEKRIPGFEAKAPEVVDYVVETYGMAKADAEKWPLNPKTAEMAYKAMLYDRMQAKASSKPKTQTAPAPVKPIKGKGRSEASSKPQDSDSVEVWLRKRERQLRKRAS